MTGTPDLGLDRHAAFVRSLAQSLLADPAAADDVAQEALVRLWQRPPQVGLAVRGWLRKVVRRLAQRRLRADARRLRREVAAGAAARGEGAAPLDGMLRAETLRAVTDAVAQLPPALRDVVLLRHHEALPPRAIAARLQLSVAAVESRLRRAHAELALRLRERLGGDRWQASLAVLVGPGFAVATPIGVTMAMKSKVALTALPAVLLVAAFVLLRDRDAPLPAPGPGRPAPAVAAAPQPAPGRNAERDGARADARDASAAAVPAPVATMLRLSGRVVDARRRPVAGATVSCAGLVNVYPTQSGDDGAFELRTGRELAAVRFAVTATKGDRVGRRGCTLDGSCDADLGTIVVEPSGRLPVRVVDRGSPVAGAAVIARTVDLAADIAATTDSRGEAKFESLCRERHLVVALADDGRTAFAVGDAWPGNEQWLTIDLAQAVSLRVVAKERGTGAPVAGLNVLCWVELPGEGGAVSYALLRMSPLPRTGADGTAVIDGLRRGGAVRVAVLRDGAELATTEPVAAKAIVPAGDRDTVEFAIDPPCELWFESAASHELPPRDGDKFGVVTFGGALRGEAVLRGDRLVYSGAQPPLGAAWFARDERRAGWLHFASVDAGGGSGGDRPAGNPVHFDRLRTCTVALRDVRVQPLVGLPVFLFAAPAQGGALQRTTDARGVATFVDLPSVGVAASLTAARPHDARDPAWLGAAELEAGDGRIERTLGAAIHVRAVVFVAGERALPGDLALDTDNGFVANVQEDVANGALQCDVVPADASKPCQLRLYGGWRLSVGTAMLDRKTTEAFVELKLEPRCAATAAIAWPPDGECQLFVERVFGPDQFSIWTHVPAGRHQDALPRFTNLAPGRYRLRDALSDVRGAEVDVDDRATAQLSLDLAMVVPVRGHVTLGAGIKPKDVWLELVDARGAAVRRWPLGDSVAFAARIDARGDVRLRAAAGERRSPAVPVTGAMDGVELVVP